MNEKLSNIENKLRAVVEREKRRDGLIRLSSAVTLLCSALIIIVLLEAAGNFDSATRSILVWIFLAGGIATFLFFLVSPFIKDLFSYKNPDYTITAKKVGDFFPQIKDELVNAVQVVKNESPAQSAPLARAALDSVYAKTEKLDFGEVVDFTKTKKQLEISFVSVCLCAFLILSIPALNSSAYRLINYEKNFSPPQKFIFEIFPGNREITKGDSVLIRIKTAGEKPAEIFLSVKSEDQPEFSEKKLLPDSLGNFVYEAFSVKNSFEYFAHAKKIKSETYKISVVSRPVISEFTVSVLPPAYSRLPETRQKDNGNIYALPGSGIKINLAASRNLSKAEILFSDGSQRIMNTASNSSSLFFTANKELDYKIVVEDGQGFTNPSPIQYSIKLMPDSPPSIEMLSPNQNIKLSGESKISLVSKISDDYGFSRMNLNYRLSTSKYRPVPEEYLKIPVAVSPNLKEDDVYYVWDLSQLILAEGEAVTYFLEVFDNDNINGPKSAKTPLFTITVPSLDALFADADKKQNEASKDLSNTLKEAEQLKKEMQKISDDLKQNSKEISWQEKEKVEKAADKFKEIGSRLDEISQKLSEMKNDLTKENFLSEETLKKYNELQDLFDKMSGDDLKEAFKKMQDALKSLNRDNVQMSMEEMKANEEYIRKSIERTLNLFKRVLVEQKTDELIKRSKELAEKIEDVKNKTSQSPLSEKQKRDELSNRQKDISSDLKNLGDEMKNLASKMNGLADMPKDQLDKMQSEFEKQNNEHLSDEAADNIKSQQKNDALQNQQKISQNMKNFGKQAQMMQSSMQQMNQTKTFLGMIKILEDLLSLSKDQENLKNRTAERGSNPGESAMNMRDQNGIQNNLSKVLQKLGDLSQRTFSITPEMGQALGRAYSEMNQSMTAMQNNQGGVASQMQKNAMGSLNESARLMKGAMDQMMNGSGSGGGMMSLMQQLQNLGQQQMNLNKLTQMMNSGELSQQMRAQMERLAQQQEMIRKSLEQLNNEAKESGQSKRLAGNLDKIVNDMKEVVSNLQSQKLNNDLIKQQEKIMTKLLDAQRSLNERDFEKERKSEEGKNYTSVSPPDLILNGEEGKNKLKDELLKAVKEGYKKDYEELIRKYFKALEKEGK